jgi:hypothetical protein
MNCTCSIAEMMFFGCRDGGAEAALSESTNGNFYCCTDTGRPFWEVLSNRGDRFRSVPFLRLATIEGIERIVVDGGLT